MNLLILNGPRNPRAAKYSTYRGTYRAHPTYCDSVPRQHELNKFFYWFLEEGGELGVVHNVGNALQYAKLLNQVSSIKYGCFEVIEVTNGNASPEVGNRLLGFDLSSHFNDSLLWWQLEPQPSVRSVPPLIQEATDSICTTYRPKLNSSGLFQTADIASGCLEAMNAVQRLYPVYEGEDISEDYQIVGIHALTSRTDDHPRP
jgi:hypothetical protein